MRRPARTLKTHSPPAGNVILARYRPARVGAPGGKGSSPGVAGEQEGHPTGKGLPAVADHHRRGPLPAGRSGDGSGLQVAR